MRWKDLSGEKLLRGEMELMCSRMVAREAAWKILGSSSLVMSRVLDGGAGCDGGGSVERSRDKGDRERFCDRDGEGPADKGGELLLKLEVWIGERLWLWMFAMVVTFEILRNISML